MKDTVKLLSVLGLTIMLLAVDITAYSQGLSNYDVAVSGGNAKVSYNQVPGNLIPVNGAVTGSYQWEQSQKPVTEFAAISGATQAYYVFPGTLQQTMYFRRLVTISGSSYYSNTVKIEVVSINNENVNYIREHDILIAGLSDWKTIDGLQIGDKLQTTSYLDGIGRPMQKISKGTATPTQQNGSWGDVVLFSQFDPLGRQPLQYLPYTTTTESGKFKSSPVTDQDQYYANVYNETRPYNSITYDNSPLNRVVNVKSPGFKWGLGPGNNMAYDLNDASDNVQVFNVDYSNNDALVHTGSYSANTLFKTRHQNEDGKWVIEYANQTGQVILSKVQIDNNSDGSGAHAGWSCTYSIYDDFGLLRYRIQPEGVKYLDANSWSFSGTNGQTMLDEYCFSYKYDEKGRAITKKAPGAKELRMLYDQRDRVVFMQDGNQRIKSTPEWTANLYDDLDRVVVTTLYATTKSTSTLQSDIANAASSSAVTTGNGSGALNDLLVPGVPRDPVADQNNHRYAARNSIEFAAGFSSFTNDNFVAEIDPTATGGSGSITSLVYKSPISSTDLNNAAVSTIVKYNFYDDYSYSSVKPFTSSFDNSLAYTTGEPIIKSARTINMATGTMVRVLGTGNFLTTSLYYDEKGRPIQTTEENIKNGQDVTTNQYQFDGRLLSSNTKHTTAGSGYSNFSIVTKNLFDKIGRTTSVQKKYGTNDFKTIASYDYDDLGRLKTKHLDPGYTGSGKNELESLSYSYNIHNQIIGINKDYALKTPGLYDKWGNFFGLYLEFDNRNSLFTSGRLDGHVAGTLWSTQGDDAQRRYDFTYDNAGRLSKALFLEQQKPTDGWSNNKMDISVTGSGTGNTIEYDLNGNLLSMIQKGVIPGSTTPVNIDDLHYSYATLSNKLTKVVDNSPIGTANGKSGDFVDGSNGQTDDYVYDDNGNLVIDLNKNAKELGGTPGANGIRYNYLDKPEEVHISGKGTIKMVYDANGNKLQKSFTPEGSSIVTTTTYVNEFIYQGDNLQYINFEEGRIRVMQSTTQNNGFDLLTINGNMDLPGSKRGAYDFFIRDYQSNVRMILTEETHVGSNSCTMETERAANEEPLFGQVDINGNPTTDNEVRARFATSSIPGEQSGGGWQNAPIGNYVSRIGNLAGKKVGPNTLLKVMAGDQVSGTTIYYYQDPVTNHNTDPSVLTNLLVSLTQAITGSGVTSGLMKNAASSLTSPLNSSTPFSALADPDQGSTAGSNPKAYLSVAFFDERFNFISEGSTSLRVQQSGSGASPLTFTNIKAPKNGYAYVYVSNVSDQIVYFDNLQVTNTRGRIIEENHYYAYGLKIASVSSRKIADPNEGHIDNKDLYNDKELIDDGDLNWYDYGFRSYDPQIGRFPQLDPLTDDYPELTPYQYASDDPILNIDLDGLEGVNGVIPEFTFIGKIAKPVTANVGKIALNAGLRIGLDGIKTGISESIKIQNFHQQETVTGISERQMKGYNAWHDQASYQPGYYIIDGFVNPFYRVYQQLASRVTGHETIRNLDGTRAGYSSSRGQNDVKQRVFDFAQIAMTFIGPAVEAATKTVTFYRAMSFGEYEALETTKGLTYMKGKELFVSAEESYARGKLGGKGYDVLVKFEMKPGAWEYFNKVGVEHQSPAGSTKWASRKVLLWKTEFGARNLGIQQNIDMFNPWILDFKQIP